MIFQKVNTKYKIMKIRQKISFIAFEKSVTIKELIVNQIFESYKVLKRPFLNDTEIEENIR